MTSHSSQSVHCSICLGMGSMDLDTGAPWEPGRRPGAKVQCDTCQGFGQFTDCPCCRGAGCWDCDGGMVAGPHHPDALIVIPMVLRAEADKHIDNLEAEVERLRNIVGQLYMLRGEDSTGLRQAIRKAFGEANR